jgi:hypothetical protein
VEDRHMRKEIEGLITSEDEGRRRLGFSRLLTMNAHYQSGSWLGTGGKSEWLKRTAARFDSWTRLLNLLADPARVDDLAKKLEQTASREARELEKRAKRARPENSLHGLQSFGLSADRSSEKRPVILFMIDGLRPDRLREAAEKGIMPNMQKLFLNNGVELKTYSTNSTTIPSWSTVVSGSEPDAHCNRGTTNGSRDPKLTLRSFIDVRVFAEPKKLYLAGKPSPTYERILMTQGTPELKENWLPGHLPKDEALISFMPVHDGTYFPIRSIIKEFTKSGLADTAFGVLEPTHTFDLAVAKNTADRIAQNPGKHRLVINYYVGVDHDGHVGKSLIDDSMKVVDQAVGLVIEAASRDPILKDAVVMAVSDHGLRGGVEPADPEREFIPEAHDMDNTTFNLPKFFTGDYPGISRQMDFVVGSHKYAERFINGGILDFWRSGVLTPHEKVWRGAANHRGRRGYKDNRTMLIEPYGDGQAYHYLLEDASRDPAIKTSYHRLTNYPVQNGSQQVNLIDSLLAFSVSNTVVRGRRAADGEDLQRKLERINGLRPVGLIALSLTGTNVRESVARLTGERNFTREPVLVRAFPDKAGLTLIRDEGDETHFKYYVIENFSQLANGEVRGKVSFNRSRDPLEMKLELKQFSQKWLTDREILTITEDSWYPTAIFSPARNLTLVPRLDGHPEVQTLRAEIPDFIAFAALGFHFNPNALHQSDHGGLSNMEVRTAFFLNDDQLALGPLVLDLPVLTRDIMPTILDYLGLGPAPLVQGVSLKPMIDEARDEDF